MCGSVRGERNGVDWISLSFREKNFCPEIFLSVLFLYFGSTVSIAMLKMSVMEKMGKGDFKKLQIEF